MTLMGVSGLFEGSTLTFFQGFVLGLYFVYKPIRTQPAYMWNITVEDIMVLREKDKK